MIYFTESELTPLVIKVLSVQNRDNIAVIFYILLIQIFLIYMWFFDYSLLKLILIMKKWERNTRNLPEIKVYYSCLTMEWKKLTKKHIIPEIWKILKKLTNLFNSRFLKVKSKLSSLLLKKLWKWWKSKI